jgi:hypothetical protein
LSGSEGRQFNVVLLYLRNSQIDGHVVDALSRGLTEAGQNVYVDRRGGGGSQPAESLLVWRSAELVNRRNDRGIEWSSAPESQIRAADAVVVVLSAASTASEMLLFEVETAVDERRKRGRPFLITVKIGPSESLVGPIGAWLNEVQAVSWNGPNDDSTMVQQVKLAIQNSSTELGPDHHLDAAGGAVSPDSVYYVTRDADQEVRNAIRARESLILIRGPRQIGKTSLIGQGVKLVDDLGWRHVSTDFQMISPAQLSDADRFARMLAATMARQLGIKYDFNEEWQEFFGPNVNLSNFMRDMISSLDSPLVWFMDEADRLFYGSFASNFFGLVRSWHNSRATDPRGPWSRFTIVISYATEARLFIRDLNQSPFNVGRHVGMRNFTIEEVAFLNERYGSPIKSWPDMEALHFLVAGQPFLIRSAFDKLVSGSVDLKTLIATADQDDGPFGDHLKRLLIGVSSFPNILEAMKSSLGLEENADSESVERLVAAGALRLDQNGKAVSACDLYSRYLKSHIG